MIRKVIPRKTRRKLIRYSNTAKGLLYHGPTYAAVPPTQRPYVSQRDYARAQRTWAKLVAQEPVSLDEWGRRNPPGEIEELIACPLCGTKELQPMFNPSGVRRDKTRWSYHVTRCPNCSHLRRNPNVRPERVGDLYKVKYSEFLSNRYSEKRQRKYELGVKAWSPWLDNGTGRRLLDFGCGNGLFLEIARKNNFDVWGVDLSPDSVEQANERLGETRAFYGRPYDHAQIAEGGFDVITMWSVLAHLATPIEDLQMIRSLLAPDGVVLIYTVNANSLQLKRYGSAWNGFTTNHLMFYSRDTVPSLLEQAGFARTEFRPYYGDTVEAGTTNLRPEWVKRIKEIEDTRGESNMMRVAGLNSERGPQFR